MSTTYFSIKQQGRPSWRQFCRGGKWNRTRWASRMRRKTARVIRRTKSSEFRSPHFHTVRKFIATCIPPTYSRYLQTSFVTMYTFNCGNITFLDTGFCVTLLSRWGASSVNNRFMLVAKLQLLECKLCFCCLSKQIKVTKQNDPLIHCMTEALIFFDKNPLDYVEIC